MKRTSPTSANPIAHRFSRDFDKIRGGPAFNPPSLRGTVVIPGYHGGATWSGASFDPTTGLLYVNSNNVPNIITLVESKRRQTNRDTGHLERPATRNSSTTRATRLSSRPGES